MAVQLSRLYGVPIRQRPLLLSPLTRRRTAVSQVRAVAKNAQELLKSGEVEAIGPKEAATAINSEGFKLLDIRPAWEWEKARVKESVHVALFVKDEDYGPIGLLKKWVHFGYIGLWTGQYLTTLNPDFIKEVEAAVPDKNTKLLVACGEGLKQESMIGGASSSKSEKPIVVGWRSQRSRRKPITRAFMHLWSLIAVSKLHKEGYKNLGWLAGGFNRTDETDFPSVEGPEKLQYATIGGVSYYFLQLLVLLQAVGKNS
ncbi:rhodanese-like domain-containing protein 10 isoform X1 [Cucumis melo var. makuwa]|uniref:Rhodanese-like domain-containing protein 10 isoform X1 n=1 Tax=Cucumis melo var. makuwa TaxID=1194695 RepID=A0A5A7TLT2_CUCMM|nr:rhodanese-like domain-containing protein 10 isoform X1 [Cucumis melo var. makuwa]